MKDDITPPTPAVHRVTINFVAPSIVAVQDLVRLTGDKQQDVVNRAVRLYARIEKERADGSELMFRRPDGCIETVVII